MPKTVIFDFDGTIADTIKIFFEINNRLAKKYRYQPLSLEAAPELLNHTLTDIALNYCKIALYKIPFVVLAFRKQLRQRVEEFELFPDAAEVLQALRAGGYKIGLVTSAQSSIIQLVLKRFELDNIFDFKICGVGTYRKAKVFRTLIRRKAFDPSQSFYVGDEPRDIKAAHKAGLKSIAVTWGFASKDLLEIYQPEVIVNNWKELGQILLKYDLSENL